ncbi:Hsp20/alpha crystallin family protein (plasmid) [Paracoccaceae bacterium]|nr:Hsp20/alpha crystallin family protein [Paracoccaceae bacterium]
MVGPNLQNTLFGDALSRLDRLLEMHRLGFDTSSATVWQPPLDLIETETELLAVVALPGVDAASVDVEVAQGRLRIRGNRSRPAELRGAAILRMELPWGPFERQVAVPNRAYHVSREAVRGCLLIRLRKVQGQENDET